MQVLNNNQPVMALEVSTNGGVTWQGTSRRDYNYFETGGGFGTDTLSGRVSCSNGGKVVLSHVRVNGNTQFTASGNC